MKVRVACLVLAVLASGCSRCAGPGPPPRGTPPVPDPVTGPQAVFSGTLPGFVVGFQGEPHGETQLVVFPIRITRKGVEIARATGLPRRDRMLPAVAVDGKHLYLARGTGVERRVPFDPKDEPRSINLEEEPASLLGAATGCFVGLKGRVDFIDFSPDQPTSIKIHHDETIQKPVDFLLPIDSKSFVGVDDQVFPRYAFVFDLVPGPVATHRFTAELPSGANEVYTGVVRVGEELVITASYAVIHGSGNTLYRWKVGKESKPALPLDEYLPRMAGEKDERTRLLAGEKLTYWRGLGAIGTHVFIGGGQRGILHLEVGEKEARLHDLSGTCRDLVVIGSRVIALVEEGEGPEGQGDRFIVDLGWDPSTKTLTEQARHPLAVRIDSLSL